MTHPDADAPEVVTLAEGIALACVARRCGACGGPIKRGEPYSRWFGTVDDEPMESAIHLCAPACLTPAPPPEDHGCETLAEGWEA